MDILVLGVGRVGSTIARDLASEPGFVVSVADRSREALEPMAETGLETWTLDFTDGAALEGLARQHDLVVSAVPGALGLRVLRGVIDAGRDTVDISFLPEDALDLDALARERGVRAVVDAGVAPGLSNMMLGHLEATLEDTESFHCLVGGLPAQPSGIWEYKAPFSPADVLEEYTRPVRLRRGGQDLIFPALEELELVDLPGVGELEAFLTDGLRTLLRTTTTPTLLEKTLRYPGHVSKVRVLRESGFLDAIPVEVNGDSVRPLDLASRLLERIWRFRPGEEDLTVMRVEVVGREGGRRVRHAFDLLDRYDRATATSSMARATGYTCTALVRWLALGGWERPGVTPPEVLARDARCFDFVMTHMAERGVRLGHRVEALEAAPTRPEALP